MAKKKREKKREIVVHSNIVQVIREPYQLFDNLNTVTDKAGQEYPICYANIEYAIPVVTNLREAALQFVFTNPNYRRKGWAAKLINHIQFTGKYDKIITGLAFTSTAGQKLCKKCGFREQDNLLVWTKEDKDERARDSAGGEDRTTATGTGRPEEAAGGKHAGEPAEGAVSGKPLGLEPVDGSDWPSGTGREESAG